MDWVSRSQENFYVSGSHKYLDLIRKKWKSVIWVEDNFILIVFT